MRSSDAFGLPLRRSGCQRLASLRYAAASSGSLTPGSTPRSSKGFTANIFYLPRRDVERLCGQADRTALVVQRRPRRRGPLGPVLGARLDADPLPGRLARGVDAQVGVHEQVRVEVELRADPVAEIGRGRQ